MTRLHLAHPLCLVLLVLSCTESGNDVSQLDVVRADASSDTLDASRDASESDDPGAIEEPPSANGGGWQLRDPLPYPRAGHAAVLDTKNDRMVVYGGGANDVWTLPLSGPHENHWLPLTLHGIQPPVHRQGAAGLLSHPDAAVYDPVRQSMIVCLTLSPDSTELNNVELWELTLDAHPHWSQLAVLRAPDREEIQLARIVLDPKAHRVLLFEGGTARARLWSLALEGEPNWTPIADAPPNDNIFFSGDSFLFDEDRERVILFGGVSRQSAVWALQLDDPHWQKLDAGTNASGAYGVAAAFIRQRDNVVIVGGDDAPDNVSILSLDGLQWTARTTPEGRSTWLDASVVVDSARDRLILFGGSVNGAASNQTWALSLSTFEWTSLDADATASWPGAGSQYLYDPVRNAIVAFGNYLDPKTFVREFRSLGPSGAVARNEAGWQLLTDPGATPQVSRTNAVYDPLAKAIVSFGGYVNEESDQLARLGSAQGAQWETMNAGDGPGERSGHAMIYDPRHASAIVFGGARGTSYPPEQDFNDVWSLSLGATPAWTELEPSGTPPGAGYGATAVYDPEARSMLVYRHGALWSLVLDGAPRWSRLSPSGQGPPGQAAAAAVYDPDARRMIVVTFEDETRADSGVRVFALALDGPLEWHEFCPDTITPALADTNVDGAGIVLVPDGLFVALGAATFRFDLATAYCG